MNARRLMKTTSEIALIRDLQRKRALQEATQAEQVHQRLRAAEEQARVQLDSQYACLRALLTVSHSSLQVELAANVGASVESAQVGLRDARTHTLETARKADVYRARFADRERLHELAETLAHRAKKSFEKADEARQSDSMEDTFRARGSML